MIVRDERRLDRILYQVKLSEPVAFRPNHVTPDAAVRGVD
jgi:hypothetical protein